MHNWFNRPLQNLVLTILAQNPQNEFTAGTFIINILFDELPISDVGKNGYQIKEKYKHIANDLNAPEIFTDDISPLPPNNSPMVSINKTTYHEKYTSYHSNSYTQAYSFWNNILLNNLEYLRGHNLVFSPQFRHFQITSKGIDFLIQDGGLSAILGIVTVKLHSETIQLLIEAKIDESPLPPEEKSNLKSMLSTIKDSALSKITENAIDQLPVPALIAALKEAIRVSILS